MVFKSPTRIPSSNSSSRFSINNSLSRNNLSAVNVIRNNYNNSNIWSAEGPNIKTVSIKSDLISKFNNTILNIKNKFIKK